ncbi:MAG: mechanosensitive ion channel [Rhodobacteraceae bacterium]|nr:mechanosensitive ion channel [Paracoccaceae bacterium]
MLENLVAGVQIALTQPIRLDDVVIVEGEWGVIEDITATYVVVRVWDWRRVIVPLKRFIDQPFRTGRAKAQHHWCRDLACGLYRAAGRSARQARGTGARRTALGRSGGEHAGHRGGARDADRSRADERAHLAEAWICAARSASS